MKSIKKLNQQGIGHHLVIAGLAVLVLGVAAFAGWRVYQGKNSIEAQASSWTRIAGNATTGVTACKESHRTGFGNFWKIKLAMVNRSHDSYHFVFYDIHPKPPTDGINVKSETILRAGRNKMDYKEVWVAQNAVSYANQWWPGYWNFSSGTGNKGGGGAETIFSANISYNNIGDCSSQSTNQVK